MICISQINSDLKKMTDWKGIAEIVLAEEKNKKSSLVPPGEYISFKWRGNWYPGTLHTIKEKEYKGMAILSKPSGAPPRELVDEISKLQPNRPLFMADNELELEGALHIVGQKGDRLIRLTPEQTIVAMNTKIQINKA